MLYKIRNNGNSRDVFVKGIKFYFSRNSSIETTNFDLMVAATKLPDFQIIELEKRKRYKKKGHLSDEHKRNLSKANKGHKFSKKVKKKMSVLKTKFYASKKIEEGDNEFDVPEENKKRITKQTINERI